MEITALLPFCKTIEKPCPKAVWIETLRSYFRSRLPGPMHFSLALFLLAGSLVADQRPDILAFILRLSLAYFLVLQFRLWDDLASREADRSEYPDRVLSKIPSVRPFLALLAICFALNGVFLYYKPDSLISLGTFLLFSGCLLLWYRKRPMAAGSVADFHVILTKYPLIVFLLSDKAQVDPTALSVSTLVVYLCFCVYEALHDRRYWSAPGVRSMLALEMTALIGVYLLGIGLATRGLALASTQALLAFASAGFFTWLFLLHRSLAPASHWNYIIFVIGFFQLLTLSFGGMT